MIPILAAGVSSELVSFLELRLRGVSVKLVRTGHEALEAFAQSGWELLVVDQHLSDPPAVEVLVAMRELPASALLPVIYCLEEHAPSELQTKLVKELGVEQLCYHPLDLEELARYASIWLKLSLRAQPEERIRSRKQSWRQWPGCGLALKVLPWSVLKWSSKLYRPFWKGAQG